MNHEPRPCVPTVAVREFPRTPKERTATRGKVVPGLNADQCAPPSVVLNTPTSVATYSVLFALSSIRSSKISFTGTFGRSVTPGEHVKLEPLISVQTVPAPALALVVMNTWPLVSLKLTLFPQYPENVAKTVLAALLGINTEVTKRLGKPVPVISVQVLPMPLVALDVS